MTDIWDAEEPEMIDRREPLCPVLFHSRDPKPFKRIWANNQYVVLKI